MMKRIFLLIVFLFLALTVYAQNSRFDIGNLSFFISPKIMNDGSITDIGLGYGYTEKLSGSLRFRSSITSKNEEIEDTEDSLNAVNEKIFEFYILPVEYYFVKTPGARFWAGGGLYYQYTILNEKGFFNMPSLELLIPPKERVNAYTNNLKMHLLGPLIETGVSHISEWFNISFSGGINPVFFLTSKQNMSMEPLISGSAKYKQNTWGSPYFFFNLDGILFKYINLVLLYDFAALKYRIIDFNTSLEWINPEVSATVQSFRIEASLLIPLGDMRAQIGYGWSYNKTQIENGVTSSGNKHYIILTAKKSGN